MTAPVTPTRFHQVGWRVMAYAAGTHYRTASLAEAIALIERTDLDPAKAVEVLTTGAPGSPLVKTLSQRMMSRDFTPNFLLKLMMKDVKYAINEAEAKSMHLATAATTLDLLERAAKAGNSEKDFSSVVEPMRRG